MNTINNSIMLYLILDPLGDKHTRTLTVSLPWDYYITGSKCFLSSLFRVLHETQRAWVKS